MIDVQIIATIMAIISGRETVGDLFARKFTMPLYPRNTHDPSMINHSNIVANPWTFPSQYAYLFVRFFSESLSAITFTPETNISIRESSADPRIASDPDAKPIIALRIASMMDITSANRIPKEGVVGRLNIERQKNSDERNSIISGSRYLQFEYFLMKFYSPHREAVSPEEWTTSLHRLLFHLRWSQGSV